MSNPRTKRPFAGAASDPAQRQITSFFTNTTPSAHPSSNPSPVIPASVQSNLLSVGMRVRKSVPEGYKTGSYSGFSLWDEQNTKNPTHNSTNIMGEGQRSRANAISAPRELMPFCGINNIGGFSAQPEPSSRHTSSMPAVASSYQPMSSIFTAGMDDDMPGLSSSQDTIDSEDTPPSSASRSRKRFFVEEEDEPLPTLNLWANHNSRAIAVPRKGRHRAKPASNSIEAGSPGQENVMVVDSDFEDADFFDQTKWEVEMNDV